MPRTAVIATAVIGVLALVASTAFALVRSAQLRTSRQQVAELRSELAGVRQGGPSSEAPSEDGPSDDPFGGGEDNPLGDLFGDGDEGLGDLFGPEAQQLAQCLEPAGQLGSRDVGEGDADAQITEISAIIGDLRELEFETDPEPEFLDDDEIAERLEEEVREDYEPEDAQLDARVLSALGAVPPDVDLLQLQTDLLTAQVAGYYDPETGEMVVRTGDTDAGLDPVAQTTLAHELQHAMADQRLELPIDETENTTEGDAALAALALIEGDATLTQQQFTIVGLSLPEQLALNSDPDVGESQRQLAEVPHFLAQSLQFPYVAGMQFVCSRFLDGGWEAVDAAYDALPATSAEILDPSRYGTAPTDPRDPGEPGDNWTSARTSTFGAAELLWLFGAPGDDPAQALDGARERALEWSGGEVAVWTAGDDTAIGVAMTQRQPDGPLCDAVTTWYERAFPDSTDAPTRTDERMVRESGAQTAVVLCSGDEVRLGIAPDLPTARVLVS